MMVKHVSYRSGGMDVKDGRVLSDGMVFLYTVEPLYKGHTS